MPQFRRPIPLLLVLMLSLFLLPSAAGEVSPSRAEGQSPQVQPQLFRPPAGAPTFVPGEVLARFRPDLPESAIERIVQSHGSRTLEVGPRSRFRRLTVPPGLAEADFAARLRRDPAVEHAQLNHAVYALGCPNTPPSSDPEYCLQWHYYSGQGHVDVEPAWGAFAGNNTVTGYNGAGVVVAVIDTGLAYKAFPPIPQALEWAEQQWKLVLPPGADLDFVNGDAEPNDDNGHGTHVANTIAQNSNNGRLGAGIANGARILPIKVLDGGGSGSELNTAEAIYLAAGYAQVINLSLGFKQENVPAADYQAFWQAVQYAYSKGVTVVAASGNDAGPLLYPAAFPEVIAVGAVKYDGAITYYSNRGPDQELVAPGGQHCKENDVWCQLGLGPSLGWNDQNGDGWPDGVLQETFLYDSSTVSYRFDDVFYQGTSMASPHVAAVAALVIGKARDLGIPAGPEYVRGILRSTARDRGPAGWDETYGWGLVDAAAAVNAVGSGVATPTPTATVPNTSATATPTPTSAAASATATPTSTATPTPTATSTPTPTATPTSAPDLAPVDLAGPTSAGAGRQISISWTVMNRGNAEARPSWYDAVYLSTSSAVDAQATRLGLYAWSQTVAPGTSYSQTETVTLPKVAAGSYYLVLRADDFKQVREADETNNERAVPIAITTPDLAPAALTAPASAGAGHKVSISWTIANQGTGEARGLWYDYLYLSPNSTVDAQATRFATFLWNTTVPAGASYNQTKTVTLPKVAAGSYYLILRTDAGSSVYEASETNNDRAIPIAITTSDLTPTTLTAPTSGGAGQQISISWTVANQGTGEARPTWYDYVYLSPNSTIDGQATRIALFNWSQVVPAGTSYSQRKTVVLPKTPAGNYYLILRTDGSNALYEADETNNDRAIPIVITTPDLVPTGLNAPASAKAGQKISVSWTVANQGTGEVRPAWYDYVYLSASGVVDSQATRLGSYARTQALAAGGSYSQTKTITLPAVAPGSYSLILRTDGSNTVYEANETNDRVLAITISP